ncbi:restriction endonuclease subunit M, partial [Helicobacter pylori]
FKPPKQKSQISLVFGMNALVPLGIKTLSETNLDSLYTP